MNRIHHVTIRLNILVAVLIAAASFTSVIHAASVGSGGYTNGFDVQPVAADWSTFSIGAGNGDYATAVALDAAATAVAASSINTALSSDAGDPPPLLGPAAWSSLGLYVQTRPTGNGATLLMCTLTNSLGVEAIAVNIGYDFAKPGAVAEEVEGHRAYYSLSGAANSWTVIPSFSSAAPGRLTATLSLAWPTGTPLYIMWADDNGAAGDSPCQIDNFSVTATPGTQQPVAITAQPQSQMVTELAPASFTVGLSGYLPPTLQWYTNDVAIPGATNLTYGIPSATLDYNGVGFKVIAQNVASNVTYSATSSVAILTVNADTIAPTLVSAVSSGGGLVLVTFSEPITAATATNLANYTITNLSGVLVITNATLASDLTNLTLFTQPQLVGSTYTLTVNGVRDLSAAGNVINANSQINFAALNYSTANVGFPVLGGSLNVLSGTAFDMTGAGSDIGGTSDQFTFGYLQKSGNFDLKVRVASLGLTDPWAKAEFMARESLNGNSAFAAAVAAPVGAGCFFQSRATTGAGAITAGAFPANYPETWLRLRRVGDVFTGFASTDGLTWVQLGSVTLAIGNPYLGFAVTSHNVGQTTAAQFRDYTLTGPATVVTAVDFASEPMAATARTTPLVISEIMYNPVASTNTNSLEFVEIYNSNPFYEDISGYRLAGDIDFTFPAGTVMQGGALLVVAKNPSYLQSVTPGLTGVLGPYTNNLPSKGTVRLRSEVDAILLEVDYSDAAPWTPGADGTGHSLVLARPSYGQNDPQSWDVSARTGGSPGQHEPLKTRTGLNAVMINEFLAHTDLPALDYIELYNHGNAPVDISGCWLSDEASTNKASTNYFQIPTNTVLAAGGFISFNQNQLIFALQAAGETIYFRNPDQTRLIDVVKYEAQENGVAMGRYPDGAKDFFRLVSGTPGATNSAPRVDDVVINEIMYGPISESSEDQFVELFNKGTNAINLRDYKFTSGIDFKFPAGAVLPAQGYVVVARNYTNLLAHYIQLNSSNCFGNFGGKLSRSGERVAIAKPDYNYTTNGLTITTNADYIVVDEVSYKVGGRWGQWANQGGSSLELIDARSNHRMAFSWGDSDETSKAPWTLVEQTGLMDQGQTWPSGNPVDRLEVIMLGEGECLLDDVMIITNLTTSSAVGLVNPGFETGMSPWVAQGNHVATSLENSGRTGTKSLHIRSTGNGDTGGNRIRVAIPAIAPTVVTMRAYARWQRGWPELLLRLRGNYMEAYGRLTVPLDLGTPGLPNSRVLTNNAPAIADLRHFPVLPAASEPVVISARVHDPDGATNVSLLYRLDPASSFTSLPMNDNGTNGDFVARDGIYSATLPGQASGAMIAFYVQATDRWGSSSQFPENAATQGREALVRFADPQFASSFAVYRMWISQNNINIYTGRPAVSNQDVDNTLVIGNYRVIYNMGARYGGSPYHQTQNSSPVTGNVHYQATVPKDDMYLGTDSFNKLHAPGNGAFDDTSIMREQISFWLVRKIGIPYLYRRYFAMYVNGNRKGGANQLMEDSQRPGGEMIDEFYPDENVGRLYKIQPWFEWDDVTVTGAGQAAFNNNRWCQINLLTSTNNALKKAAYRHNWLARSADQTANNYDEVFALAQAASLPSSSPLYWQSFSALVDVDQWAKMFAVEHAVGNWDSFGNRNAQNTYGYKPKNGKWKQFIWDYNIVLGNSGSDGPGVNLFQSNGSDPSMIILNSYPPFRRAWLRAYKKLAVGPNAPMLAANVDPVIDARTAAITANGITPGTPGSAVKSYIVTARAALAAEVTAADVANFTVSTPNASGTTNLITITGTAPLEITEIRVNGSFWPVVWTSTTAWTATVPVTNSTQLALSAYDENQRAVGATNLVNVTFTNPIPSPVGFVVFNEIMYTTPTPDAEYLELFNSHTNVTFDLSGWRINGLNFTFPSGSIIRPRSFVVLAKSRTTFSVKYGPTIPVLAEFSGSLQSDGETLTLIRPSATTNTLDLVVDKVRYDSSLPWPLAASGTGSSLQVIDPNQDNSRVGNWSAFYSPPVYSGGSSTPAVLRDGWRFVSASGNTPSGLTNLQRLVVYLGEAGSALVDDFSLVPGTNAAVGTNYVVNGDFESPFTNGTTLATNGTVITNGWIFSTNYTNTLIVGDLVHAGAGAMKIIGTSPGAVTQPNFNKIIYQFLTPTPLTNALHTFSFWYWSTNSATNLFARLLNGSKLTSDPALGSGATNINLFITPSNYVPPGLVSPATVSLSPGSNNTSLAVLPAFPTLWINEVLAENGTGLLDAFGEREPWIEIYNPSTNTVSLDGLYLSSSYTNLTNWAFPAGHSLTGGQFLVVFCDGQPGQTTNAELHTGFRLAAASGAVALTRLYSNAPQVLDYVNYAGLHTDRSYGSYPDGQPFDRQEFFYVTPGGTNDGRSAPLTVFVNEWLAGNVANLADPADGQFNDWFELYNPTTNAVELAGYYLTDTFTNKTKFLITTNMAHVIAPLGHLLVWADNQAGQNTVAGVPRPDLHVNFQLALGGEAIGLFAADGTTIDFISFGPQTNDVSQGRFPDGAAGIYYMPGTVTPRAVNQLAGGPANVAPVLDGVGNKVLYLGQSLNFTATATDSNVPAQGLTFTLDAGAPAGASLSGAGVFTWTPGVLGTNLLTVRVTDNGTPPLDDHETITVAVLARPGFSRARLNGQNYELTWGTRAGQTYAVEYKDDLAAPLWTPLQTNTALGDSLSLTNATTNSSQRFFRLRSVP